MNSQNILTNIRMKYLKQVIWSGALGIITVGALIFIIAGMIDESFSDYASGLWVILIFFAMSIIFIWWFLKNIPFVINPLKSTIFKKYGNIDKIEEIIDEIENDIEYQDKRIIVSRNYVLDKKDVENLVAYKDILRVHKYIHKTNFQMDGCGLVITDKYGDELRYLYGDSGERTVDKLIYMISEKTSKAKVGYTTEAAQYVEKNKIDIDEKLIQCKVCGKSIEENEYGTCFECHQKILKRIEEKNKVNSQENNEIISNEEILYCTKCGKQLKTEWKFCMNCGNKIDR